MRRQQVLVADEERPVLARHDVAGVLAGEDEPVGDDAPHGAILAGGIGLERADIAAPLGVDQAHLVRTKAAVRFGKAWKYLGCA